MNPKKELITFDDYETISDTLLYLGPGCNLKMNVTIGGKSKDNEKVPLSTEYQYRTNKYINKDKVISVKRKFFPYLAIEYKDQSEILGKGTIRITHYEILGFQEKVNNLDRIIMEPFAIRGEKLFIITSKAYNISCYLNDNIIIFSPTIIAYQDNTKNPGVRMEINQRISVDLPIKTWKALVYHINKCDLYGWAASIISGYTQNDIGMNMQDMSKLSKDPTLGEDFPEETGFRNTKPITKEEKRKSFFDE